MTTEIMFEDLNEEGKKKVLKEFGIKGEKEGNFEVCPVFILECED